MIRDFKESGNQGNQENQGSDNNTANQGSDKEVIKVADPRYNVEVSV